MHSLERLTRPFQNVTRFAAASAQCALPLYAQAHGIECTVGSIQSVSGPSGLVCIQTLCIAASVGQIFLLALRLGPDSHESALP